MTRGRENARLARAIAMADEIRDRSWCGAMVFLGPMVNGRTMGANLYLEPGTARFDVEWNDGRHQRLSRRAIIGCLNKRLAKLQIVGE